MNTLTNIFTSKMAQLRARPGERQVSVEVDDARVACKAHPIVPEHVVEVFHEIQIREIRELRMLHDASVIGLISNFRFKKLAVLFIFHVA